MQGKVKGYNQPRRWFTQPESLLVADAVGFNWQSLSCATQSTAAEMVLFAWSPDATAT